jgi:hypothetical protein
MRTHSEVLNTLQSRLTKLQVNFVSAIILFNIVFSCSLVLFLFGFSFTCLFFLLVRIN